MEYLFFGPYWLFCLARAVFSAAFGDPVFGAFDGWFGLLVGGALGTAVWLLMLILIAGLIGAVAGYDPDDK